MALCFVLICAMRPRSIGSALMPAGAEIDEAGESEEDIESPSDTPMRAESSHEQSIRRGVAELEAAPDDVRYAAAIAALVRTGLLCCSSAMLLSWVKG